MPTFTHGKNAVLKVADTGATMRDVSSVINKANLKRSAETAETSALGSASKSYIAGLKDATISLDGMADATVSGYLDGILGSTTTWEFYPAGTTAGNVKYTGSAILTSLETGAEIGGVVSLAGELQVTGDVTRGTA